VPAKLLIADDSTTIQKVFERTFPPTEFSLSFANNGEEALAKAKTDRPQVLIADINMPVKNGFEVCEAVKNDPAFQGMPVLLLVGILDDFDEDESQRVCADGFIVKPFEAGAALNKVREALKKGGTIPAQRPGGGQKEQETGVSEFLKQTVPSSLKSPFQQQAGEDVVELSEVVEEPSEGALEFADFLKESPPVSKELEDIFKGSLGPPSSPPHAAKQEDAFVLQSPLRDLEAELKAEFPEELAPEVPLAREQAPAPETPLFSETEQDESWSLDLDLPFDTVETEPRPRETDWAKMFNESNLAGPGQEIKDERLDAILGESATELERIDDLGAPRAKPPQREEEFAGRFMDSYEPVFEREGEEQHIDLLSPDLKKGAAAGAGDLAERVAAAVSREMKTIVEDVIRERVPGLVRQILEQSKKE
jgi:CheY-like chemotaxis protein